MAWNPFGVNLEIAATAGTVTRKSATQFTVKITAEWETYYSGAQTNYGMTASSGGSSVTLNPFGTKSSGNSGSFTGTYSISGNASATKTITVTFRNFNNDNGDSATKTINLSVSVPAWTSYTIKYNANGGSGAPSSQTKWKDQTLILSSTKPTRTGYSFQGWATSASGSVAYNSGASYTANAAVTLYAVWKANTYTVKYNANGGTGAPGNQTKTYGQALTLSSTKPTRTNYNFKGWGTSASATTVSYAAGASYTANAAITLYAIWELAYTKPRITNFTVKRCDSTGAVKEDGTYALVGFSWACDKAVSSITIKWKLSTASSYSSSVTVTASGTSGTVSKVVGSGSLLSTSSYTIQVNVADSVGSAAKTLTLNSLAFTIHGRPGGNGIAFGKAAELDGVAEFIYRIKAAFGEIVSSPVELPEGTNLDNVQTAGHYMIGSTAVSATVLNKPPWYASTNSTAYIRVESAGNGQQIIQRYYPCDKDEQFEIQRIRYSNAWSEWLVVGGCTPWKNLTIASGFGLYSGTAANQPKYRVSGNVVTVMGVLSPTAEFTSSTTGVTIASGIPANYRPSVNLQFVCQGSGMNNWCCSITTSGTITIARYGTTATTTVPDGAWLPFCVTYQI
jgi:uncharacterized repeat protein (TIGR02543 family)